MGWETLVDWERATWQEAETALSRIHDAMGHGIDAGILAPVVGLNLLGLHTTSSCEGHLHWGCPYPWIDFYREVENAEETGNAVSASSAESALPDPHAAQARRRALLAHWTQQDPLYQRLLALQTEYLATRSARRSAHNALILLAPFAPGWYRLLAAEPGWWQRWEESEVAEETAWWEETPLPEQAERLAHAQAEMAAFATFLKQSVLTKSQRESVQATHV